MKAVEAAALYYELDMDIYAQVMYNTPKDTAQKVKSAFGESAES